MNPHPLYLEQQAYFNQFKNPLEQLVAQGYKRGVCIGLLRRYNGNMDIVLQHLQTQKDRITNEFHFNSAALVLDCNNMKYSSGKWNEFQNKPNKQIKKTIKCILKWLESDHNQLQNVYLFWDVLDFNRAVYNRCPKFEWLFSQMREQSQNCYMHIKVQDINIYITQTYPQSADDAIVDFLGRFDNSKTTVVTSDQGLRMRLNEIGVNQFHGGGEFWHMGKEMKCNKTRRQRENLY